MHPLILQVFAKLAKLSNGGRQTLDWVRLDILCHRHRLHGYELLGDVIAGMKNKDGLRVERDQKQNVALSKNNTGLTIYSSKVGVSIYAPLINNSVCHEIALYSGYLICPFIYRQCCRSSAVYIWELWHKPEKFQWSSSVRRAWNKKLEKKSVSENNKRVV